MLICLLIAFLPLCPPQVKVGFKVTQEHTLGQAAMLPLGIKGDYSRRLFKRADFVAMSAYAPLPITLKKADMEASAQVVEDQLSTIGVSMRGKKLYYGEFGLGGGTSPFCDRPAKRPVEVSFSRTKRANIWFQACITC